MKKSILLMAIALSSTTAFAQPERMGDKKERREKIEAIKVAYITEELDLTVEESQKFWPVYNELQKKELALREDGFETMKTLKDGGNDKEVEKALYSVADVHIAIEELRKSYLDDFIEVLGAQKTAKLFKAEREFGRRMMERMQKRDRPRDNGPRGQAPPHPSQDRPMR